MAESTLSAIPTNDVVFILYPHYLLRVVAEEGSLDWTGLLVEEFIRVTYKNALAALLNVLILCRLALLFDFYPFLSCKRFLVQLSRDHDLDL